MLWHKKHTTSFKYFKCCELQNLKPICKSYQMNNSKVYQSSKDYWCPIILLSDWFMLLKTSNKQKYYEKILIYMGKCFILNIAIWIHNKLIAVNGSCLTQLTLKRNIPNNMFLNEIGKNCPNLQELDIAGAEVVTDFGMVCLLYADPEQIFLKCWNRLYNKFETRGSQINPMIIQGKNCGPTEKKYESLSSSTLWQTDTWPTGATTKRHKKCKWVSERII